MEEKREHTQQTGETKRVKSANPKVLHKTAKKEKDIKVMTIIKELSTTQYKRSPPLRLGETQQGPAQGKSHCGHPIMSIIPKASWIYQRLDQRAIPQGWAGKTSRAINS